VSALGEQFGVHPGHRAAHAKGVFLEGAFRPDPGVGALSVAPHLEGAEVGVTARFSNASGNPALPDNDRIDARGMAVKFHPPGGEETDIVGLSLPVFFARTVEQFLEFTRARRPDPETGQPDGAALGSFLGAHPEVGAALASIVPTLGPPRSYATLAYDSLHAFALLDREGERRWVRWRLEPEAGVEKLGEEEIDDAGPDYLAPELRVRLDAGPVRFALRAQLAGPEDPLDDPTLAWPADREWVEAGRIELTAITDPEAPERPVVFDPMNLCEGIEPSEDEILQIRSGAYSVSAARRTAS
jgi:catalase